MRKLPVRFIALCVLPAFTLTVVFMLYPMLNAVWMSLTDSTALSLGLNARFIGLENYSYLLTDKNFLQALGNTGKLLLVVPAVTIALSVALAFVLTQSKLREKAFYRTVYFLPSILSLTVVAILWSFVFNPTRGVLNRLLEVVGLENLQHAWLGESGTALWCIAAALVWQATGYYMVMLVASIDGISADVYEAADIDGATAAQKLFRITIPLLKNAIGVTYVLSLSGTINLSFTLSNVMTGGGPNGASSVLLQYMYKQGMRNANFGYAMSIAMCTLALAVGLSVITRRYTSNRGNLA